MPASNSQLLIERLPNELLERIFLFTSTQDVLRLSSVRSQRPLRLVKLLTAEHTNFGRLTGFSVVLYKLPPQFNTRSTSLAPGYNEIRGRKHPSPIAAQPSKRTAGSGKPLTLSKSGIGISTYVPSKTLLSLAVRTGSSGRIRSNFSPWDPLYEAFQEENGMLRSSTWTLESWHFILKPTLWL